MQPNYHPSLRATIKDQSGCPWEPPKRRPSTFPALREDFGQPYYQSQICEVSEMWAKCGSASLGVWKARAAFYLRGPCKISNIPGILFNFFLLKSVVPRDRNCVSPEWETTRNLGHFVDFWTSGGEKFFAAGILTIL